jgi:hypothetical protein
MKPPSNDTEAPKFATVNTTLPADDPLGSGGCDVLLLNITLPRKSTLWPFAQLCLLCNDAVPLLPYPDGAVKFVGGDEGPSA